jgi:molybdopterin molybdotransferase
MAPIVLSYAAARARVLGAARPLSAVRMDLATCAGRALRETVRAPHPLPPFDNSAMDGYAVHAADLAAATPRAPVLLKVARVIAAGAAPGAALAPGTAARIMTGAMIPEGADAIVAFEDCERLDGPDGERARFVVPAAPGAHIRPAGADVARGAVVLEAGRELTPHDLALLAALGIARPRVGPRPRVAILSTGDELLEVGEALRPGTIRDSNALMLRALLEEAGCDVVTSERSGDEPEAVSAALRRAAERGDVMITIGGVSAGDFDPVKTSLAAVPGAELWRVAMKPGRPQAFGASSGHLFFGLPGNPASVACVFEALVRPALRRLQGHAVLQRPNIRVRATERIESRRGRTDFVRVRLEWREGGWWAAPSGSQVSGHLTPQSRADALLVVPEAADEVSRGAECRALLLHWPRGARHGGAEATSH